jgi:NADH:ubiquinone reductase (H+-translocating)
VKPEPTARRILVVGGGFIGMYAARRLERLTREGHTVTLVNPENFMQYQPFLPEVASGTIDPRAVVVPLRTVLRRTRLVIGEVERIDHAARTATVRLPDGRPREVPYDIVVIGTGSRSRVLPIPGLAGRAVGFKTVAEAIYLRNRVLSRLDLAAEADDEDARRSALTFVFVGAGYAGVEALAELEDLARDAIGLYPGLSREDMRWVLVEAAGAILPELGADLASYAQRRLEARGIEVLLNTRLASAEDGAVVLSDGMRFRADTLVWTAGVKPTATPDREGWPVDASGRLRVDGCLRVEGIDDAWAAGDVAAVPDVRSGGIAPPSAQYALREARRLADNVIASIHGREPEPFRWKNLGGLCALGRYKGVANVMGVKLRGFPAWFVHRTYHLAQMPTAGRKVRIMLDWTVALFFRRDLAQLGSLERPREPFERAAGD